MTEAVQKTGKNFVSPLTSKLLEEEEQMEEDDETEEEIGVWKIRRRQSKFFGYIRRRIKLENLMTTSKFDGGQKETQEVNMYMACLNGIIETRAHTSSMIIDHCRWRTMTTYAYQHDT
ncbi:hypothetical protein BsWGS_15576 [Bradybaena similaris]